jgi:CelD/BcsL family acetyltransferase involved in cellulose biosynthesis
MLERRRWGLRRLLWVGSGITDYLDALVREGWEEQVAEAGMWALGQINFWRVADLQELRPEAAAWAIFGGWPGLKATVWQSNCPIIDVKPWDELVKTSLSRNRRSTVRRTLRHAEAAGLRRELAGVQDAEKAARRAVALHQATWQDRDINPEHLTRRFEEHIATAAYRMTARSLGGVSGYHNNDGEMIVSDLLIFGQDFVGTYLQGASQEALRIYQVSSLYIWDGLNIALSRNSRRFDLLRGEEEYKLRWSSEVKPNHRLILGRNPLFWGPYAGYYSLRSKLRNYVHSERAPRWVKEVNGGRARYVAAILRRLNRDIHT